MEENYKLEKEYTIPYDTFRDAYREYQKIYVFPKSRIKTVLFAIAALAVMMIGSMMFVDADEKIKYIFYLFFVIFCVLSFRSWHTPNKMRANLVQSVQALGEPVYKIGIGGGFIDISTVSDDTSNDIETDEPAEDEPLPEKTRLTVNNDFQLYEYDSYFLIVPDTSMLYILPKKGFSESELTIIRDVKKQ